MGGPGEVRLEVEKQLSSFVEAIQREHEAEIVRIRIPDTPSGSCKSRSSTG
jgi:hypothetical protein